MKTPNPLGTTSEEVVVEARMQLTVSRAVLVVEGATDMEALESHVSSAVALVIAGGKNNALKAASLMDEFGDGPQLAVLVDRDHDGDRGVGNRVLVTTARDLDVELLCSGSTLRSLLKMIGLGTNSVDDRRAQIIALARPASALLNVVENRQLGLPASKVRLGSLTKLEGLEPRVVSLVGQVIQRAMQPALEQEELVRLVMDELLHMEDGLHACQGHFVHQATAALASRNSADQIQRMVWGAVQRHDFLATQVGQAIAQWGRAIEVEVLSASTHTTAA